MDLRNKLECAKGVIRSRKSENKEKQWPQKGQREKQWWTKHRTASVLTFPL
jgi:hypothetical protein